MALALFAGGCMGGGTDGAGPASRPQESGTDELLVGLHVVSENVVWAAGTSGTYAWTDDGGRTWHTGAVPGAERLQFRDVHVDRTGAVRLLAIGPGDASRIYRTTDQGASWHVDFQNDLNEAFFDCFDFWDDGAGLAFSDAVGGAFPIARTMDGRAWDILPSAERPRAQAQEGGFAASGTCLLVLDDGTALIGTGNAADVRVLRTGDRGRTWASSTVPIQGGEAAGITTLAFLDGRRGVALGGDLTYPDDRQENTAVTDDGGMTWQAATSPGFPGAVYGSTHVPGSRVLVAVGPGGAAFSLDHAGTWAPIDSLGYWSVDAAGPNAVWAVGVEGRVTRFDFRGIR